MKAQLQKIVAWGKAHPVLAAGILGAIVLLVYLAYKNGYFGGGGGGSAGASAGPSPSGTTTADSGAAPVDQTGIATPTGSGAYPIGNSLNPIPASAPFISDPGYALGASLLSPSSNFLTPAPAVGAYLNASVGAAVSPNAAPMLIGATAGAAVSPNAAPILALLTATAGAAVKPAPITAPIGVASAATAPVTSQYNWLLGATAGAATAPVGNGLGSGSVSLGGRRY